MENTLTLKLERAQLAAEKLEHRLHMLQTNVQVCLIYHFAMCWVTTPQGDRFPQTTDSLISCFIPPCHDGFKIRSVTIPIYAMGDIRGK